MMAVEADLKPTAEEMRAAAVALTVERLRVFLFLETICQVPRVPYKLPHGDALKRQPLLRGVKDPLGVIERLPASIGFVRGDWVSLSAHPRLVTGCGECLDLTKEEGRRRARQIICPPRVDLDKIPLGVYNPDQTRSNKTALPEQLAEAAANAIAEEASQRPIVLDSEDHRWAAVVYASSSRLRNGAAVDEATLVAAIKLVDKRAGERASTILASLSRRGKVLVYRGGAYVRPRSALFVSLAGQEANVVNLLDEEAVATAAATYGPADDQPN